MYASQPRCGINKLTLLSIPASTETVLLEEDEGLAVLQYQDFSWPSSALFFSFVPVPSCHLAKATACTHRIAFAKLNRESLSATCTLGSESPSVLFKIVGNICNLEGYDKSTEPVQIIQCNKWLFFYKLEKSSVYFFQHLFSKMHMTSRVFTTGIIILVTWSTVA